MAVRENISEELQKYGYVFSWKKNIVLYVIAFLSTILLGRLFRLQGITQILLCIGTLLMFPFFLMNTYRSRYNQKRFSDLNIYMEQYLYSFQKTGKVLETLEDVSKLCVDGEMKTCIEEALSVINHTFDEVDVERKALGLIYQAYPYSGLMSMHSFSLDVEKNGGEYGNAILLLLESRRMWADRNYELLKEKKHERTRVILSIITTLLLCSMIYLLSMTLKLDVADNPIAQAVTLIVLLSDLWIFYLADRKFSQDDAICDQKQKTEDVLKAAQRMKKYKRETIFGKMAYRAARKRVMRQVEKDFPKWLMQISLLLQSDNVQVAIQKSYHDAPEILKEPILEMVYEMQVNPAGMEPYLHFLEEYGLPEVSSSMKMLYSISEGTGGDVTAQIGDIIRRNQALTDRADRLKNEDAMAGMYALFLAPQITGGFKLAVDMVLLFIVYMARLGNLS